MLDSIRETVTLNNGVAMPWLGLGTYRAHADGEIEQAINWAFEAGYRSIDTASVYKNEQGVGRALAGAEIPREEIFVTTKLWNDAQGYDTALQAFDESLSRLQLDYVDLYLIHWPVPGKFLESWRACEEIYSQKRARAIGVSNFMPHHLRDLMTESQITPAVNQVEFHPRLVQMELLRHCQEQGIQLQAWSPIMRGEGDNVELLQELAAKHQKTPAQIVLRWDLQHGIATIPKSSNRERIRENAGIFDFTLTNDQIAAIDALHTGKRIGPDPDNFDL